MTSGCPTTEGRGHRQTMAVASWPARRHACGTARGGSTPYGAVLLARGVPDLLIFCAFGSCASRRVRLEVSAERLQGCRRRSLVVLVNRVLPLSADVRKPVGVSGERVVEGHAPLLGADEAAGRRQLRAPEQRGADGCKDANPRHGAGTRFATDNGISAAEPSQSFVRTTGHLPGHMMHTHDFMRFMRRSRPSPQPPAGLLECLATRRPTTLRPLGAHRPAIAPAHRPRHCSAIIPAGRPALGRLRTHRSFGSYSGLARCALRRSGGCWACSCASRWWRAS